jgi:hypothetical protein
MNSKIKKVIREIQEENLPKERIEKRKKYEDSAIEIITKHLGKLTKDHVGKVIDFLDSDYWEGKQTIRRFGLLFWGRNRKLIVGNDEKKMNLLFSEVYGKEKLDEVEVLISDLKGVGDGFVSCTLYLKDRSRYNVFVNATAEGIKAAFPEEPDFYGSFEERYSRFNELVNKLRKECNLEPQEVDVVLTVLPSLIGEAEEEEVTEAIPVKPEIIDSSKSTHTDVQGILVELGNLLGHKTYVADPSGPYKGKRLKDWATLGKVPPFTYPDTLETARKVDVIWFAGIPSYPIACFEVEHTTDVTKGLLRLYRLKGLGAKFFVIARSNLKGKFESELTRTPFYEMKDRYIFRSYEQLATFFDLAMRYHSLKKTFL